MFDGRLIDSDGTEIVKTPVVYAGLDLNSLANIDIRLGTFSADFFLRLRTRMDLPWTLMTLSFLLLPTERSWGRR